MSLHYLNIPDDVRISNDPNNTGFVLDSKEGPYNSGKEYESGNMGHRPPIREIEKVCKKHNIDMGAAALQFSLKDKRITSSMCGVTSIESIEKNLKWANADISTEFWNEILKLPFSSVDPEAERVFTPG